MKKLLLIFLLLPIIGFSQDRTVFNKFKYVYLPPLKYQNGGVDIYGLSNKAQKKLKYYGFKVIADWNVPEEVKLNPCLAVTCLISHSTPNTRNFGTNSVNLVFKDCQNKIIYSSTGEYGLGMNVQGDFAGAVKIALNFFRNFKHKYDETASNLTLESSFEPNVLIIKNDTIDLASEVSIRKYFDDNGSENIEGIWEVTGDANYRISIIKDDYIFKAYNLEKNRLFFPGDYKASIEEASAEGVFTINWKMGNKLSNKKIVGISKNTSLIEFTIDKTPMIMYKVYPKTNKSRRKSGEWLGNGSGIIISKSGYIITNHHVIDDADDIEVEFILDDEVQNFNAEIVQSDKVNDLAVIKIVDINFDGVKELPYNLKTRSSDVGTKVYAFGYPMALSIMGKEIKVTDGIISSKTGFDGDITTYQISAPIQGGNSGGPLFDDKGNFIGINSSGINKKLADNVGYSIKTSYVLNLIDILPKSIDLPSNKKLSSLPLTEQIKEITKYVVLVKVR